MIVHTGEALIDFIPHPQTQGEPWYQPSPGGSPYNTAIAAARLEVPNAFLGKVSRDFFGDQLVSNLDANGVGTQLIVPSDKPSTLAFVKKMPDGQPRYAFFSNGAAHVDLRPEDLPEIPQEARAIQFGSISIIPNPVSDTILGIVEGERDRVVSFDPNVRTGLITDESDYRDRLRRAVAASTIVKVSDEDMEWYGGSSDLAAGARGMIAAGASLVVLTEGEKGAHAFCGGRTVSVPAVPTTVSDTVGAGDSFHAALLAWLYHKGLLSREAITELQEDQLRALLGFAVGVAAKTCSRPGADPPRLGEVPLE